MMRATIKKMHRDAYSGAVWDQFFTVDFESPELQAAMSEGGIGESGYSIPQLLCVEILKEIGAPND